MNRDNPTVSARRLTALMAATAIVLHPFGVLAGDVLPTGWQGVAGSRSGNGQVYLVNPDGIAFAPAGMLATPLSWSGLEQAMSALDRRPQIQGTPVVPVAAFTIPGRSRTVSRQA